jgi:hypothetical protein
MPAFIYPEGQSYMNSSPILAKLEYNSSSLLLYRLVLLRMRVKYNTNKR